MMMMIEKSIENLILVMSNEKIIIDIFLAESFRKISSFFSVESEFFFKLRIVYIFFLKKMTKILMRFFIHSCHFLFVCFTFVFLSFIHHFNTRKQKTIFCCWLYMSVFYFYQQGFHHQIRSFKLIYF